MMLKASNLCVSAGGKAILSNVCLQAEAGQWLMVLGPNGVGKSTLMDVLSCSIPFTGTVCVSGTDLRTLSPKGRARLLGVMQQKTQLMDAFTVEQVVAMGRYAYCKGLLNGQEADLPQRVETALRQVGLAEKRHQSMLTLSGGESQRTFLAQVLCQDPQILLLDEPANHLDLVYQQQLFSLVDAWRKQPGRLVVSVVHDLSIARRFGTHALLLSGGQQVASGPIAQVMQDETLNAVWQTDVRAWREELHQAWG